MKNVILIIAIIILSNNYANSQVHGCTDPVAVNYNIDAEINDGSCVYEDADVSVTESYLLSDTIDETSGLIMWNGYLWTHNDDTDINIYALDTTSGEIVDYLTIEGVTNTDWEEIAQDEEYIYIGDFGNNANGNRTDLHILKVNKESLVGGEPIIDTIHFVYEDQYDFSPQGGNSTEFDCEALIVTEDSIFLFTKDWVNLITCVYMLPKTPGSYEAEKLYCYDVGGLITGLTFLEEKNLLVLCGYTIFLEPFLYLLYDFNNHDFFSGNKRKVNVSLPFHQVEAVKTTDGLKYFLTNEYFSYSMIEVHQQFHILYLDEFLEHYISPATEIKSPMFTENDFSIYPNPSSSGEFSISYSGKHLDGLSVIITDSNGRTVERKKIESDKITFSNLSLGLYILNISHKDIIVSSEKIIIK